MLRIAFASQISCPGHGHCFVFAAFAEVDLRCLADLAFFKCLPPLLRDGVNLGQSFGRDCCTDSPELRPQCQRVKNRIRIVSTSHIHD